MFTMVSQQSDVSLLLLYANRYQVALPPVAADLFGWTPLEISYLMSIQAIVYLAKRALPKDIKNLEAVIDQIIFNNSHLGNLSVGRWDNVFHFSIKFTKKIIIKYYY